MNERQARNTVFEIDGKHYTLTDIEKITGVKYKTLHYRLGVGYTPEELLKPEMFKTKSEQIRKDCRLKNFHECIGETSGLLKAVEVVTDEDKHWIKAICECGAEIIFKSPSSFRIGKSCKSVSCTTKSSLITKEENGTRYKQSTTPEEKTCSKCGQTKSRNMFYKSNERSDGLHSQCSQCLKESPSRTKEYHREYRDNNRDHLRIQTQINKKRRRSEDISYRLEDNLRSRLNCAIRGKNKSARTMELIGCTIEFMIEHLEAQFEPLMTWDNYGEWHVDHIIPCSSFDFTKEEDQRKCFHYSNLQPLWATSDIAKIYGSTKIGNIEKSDRLLTQPNQASEKST